MLAIHAFAPLLAILSLFKAISAQGDVPPPTNEQQPVPTIENGSCAVTYTPIRGSCSYYEDWTYSPSLDTLCKAQGCVLIGADIGCPNCRHSCRGDPSCANPLYRKAQFCQESLSCTCNAGYRMVGDKCQELLCEGKYLLYETWSYHVRGGTKWFQCQGKDNVYSWVACNPETPNWDGFESCYSGQIPK